MANAAKKLLSDELIEERREEQRRENEQDAARTTERKRLFWKQIEQARKDVEAWPDYLRRAFGVKP